jgi:hypothetical protein
MMAPGMSKPGHNGAIETSPKLRPAAASRSRKTSSCGSTCSPRRSGTTADVVAREVAKRAPIASNTTATPSKTLRWKRRRETADCSPRPSRSAVTNPSRCPYCECRSRSPRLGVPYARWDHVDREPRTSARRRTCTWATKRRDRSGSRKASTGPDCLPPSAPQGQTQGTDKGRGRMGAPTVFAGQGQSGRRESNPHHQLGRLELYH